jgi:hypothetical protein
MTLRKLCAEKEKLIERLQQDVGPEERYEIERLPGNINAALDSLDEARPGPRKVTPKTASRPRLCHYLHGPRSAPTANALNLAVENGIFLVQCIIRIG